MLNIVTYVSPAGVKFLALGVGPGIVTPREDKYSLKKLNFG